ncbi:MAG: hypothetical protein ICV76_00595 [Nitrospiraceae bacterium]|nr:hypothetical protein [Nitrospiraceae bacterium]
MFTQDDKHLITWSEDQTIRVWDATGEWKNTHIFQNSGVSGLSPDGKYLATVQEERTTKDELTLSIQDNERRPKKEGRSEIVIWETATGRQLPKFTSPATVTNIHFCECTESSKYMITTFMDSKTLKAKVWDVLKGKEVATLPHYTLGGWGVGFSRDEKYIAVPSADDHTVKVWNADTGEQRYLLRHDDIVNDVGFNRDGRFIVTAGSDRKAKVWDMANGLELRVLNHTAAVLAGMFSVDDKYIFTVSEDQKVAVWEALTGRERYTINAVAPIVAIWSSSDNKFLVLESEDKRTQVFDIATGQKIVSADRMVLAKNAQYLASITDKLSILDLTTRKEILSFPGDVQILDFSPDGKHIAMAHGHTLGINDIHVDDLIDRALARATKGVPRSFTTEECAKYFDMESSCPTTIQSIMNVGVAKQDFPHQQATISWGAADALRGESGHHLF